MEKVELHVISLDRGEQRMGRDNWKSNYFNSLQGRWIDGSCRPWGQSGEDLDGQGHA